MYKCDICKEYFNFRDEVIFVCDGEEVSAEEEGGSGDIDTTICMECLSEIIIK